MYSAPTLRQTGPPTRLPYPRPRHPIRRDATRVLAGYFDRPWKSTLNDAVLVNLPNGSKVVANNDASTSSTKTTVTAPPAPPSAPPLVNEDQGFGSPIISIVAVAMVRKEMEKKGASGSSKSAKPTMNRRQSEHGTKSGATSASTSKPKAPSNLSKEVIIKPPAPAPAKVDVKTSSVTVPAPLTKSSSTSSAATLAITNNNNKRPIDSSPQSTSTNDRDRRPAKKARKSAPAKLGPKPISTATSDTSVSTSLPIAAGPVKKGWKGWVALPDSDTGSAGDEGDGEGEEKKAREGDDEGSDSGSERTPTPPPTRGRKGWKGWAIASSPPDESKLILIDKVPVIQGRITRSGRSFGERDEPGGGKV